MSRSVSAPSSVTNTSPCWNGDMVPGSTLRYGTNLSIGARSPRWTSNRPSDAAAIPLPREETTPPVTNTYFVVCDRVEFISGVPRNRSSQRLLVIGQRRYRCRCAAVQLRAQLPSPCQRQVAEAARGARFARADEAEVTPSAPRPHVRKHKRRCAAKRAWCAIVRPPHRARTVWPPAKNTLLVHRRQRRP